MQTKYRTRWPELAYEHVSRGLWRFVALSDTPAHVGPHYPTRKALLDDMPHYARENWGLS